MKKIIIIGSRRRNEEIDYLAVYKVFRKVYNYNDVIISGGCRKGGDKFAEQIAERHGMTKENGQLVIHLPMKPEIGSPRFKWVQVMYDRNTVVANEAEADSIIIACISKDRTGGTEDTLKKIEKFGRCKNIILV